MHRIRMWKFMVPSERVVFCASNKGFWRLGRRSLGMQKRKVKSVLQINCERPLSSLNVSMQGMAKGMLENS